MSGGVKFKVRRGDYFPPSEHLEPGQLVQGVDKAAIGFANGEEQPRWYPEIDIDGNMVITDNMFIRSDTHPNTYFGFSNGHFQVYVGGKMVLDADPVSGKLFSSLSLTNDITVDSIGSNDVSAGFSYKNGVFTITAPLQILGGLNLSSSDLAAGIIPTVYNAGDIFFAGSPHAWGNPAKMLTDLNYFAPLVFKSSAHPERTLNLDFKNRAFTGINKNNKGVTDSDLVNMLSKFGSSFARSTPAYGFNSEGVYTSFDTNAPRYTYNPYTGEPLGIRLEGSSKNLIINSSDLSSWDAGNLSALLVTRGFWTAIGLHNPYMLTEAGNGEHFVSKSYYSQPANQSLAYSTFIEIPPGSTTRVALTVNSNSTSFGAKFTLRDINSIADSTIQMGTGQLKNTSITRITSTIFRIGITGVINTADSTNKTVTAKFQTLDASGNTVFNSNTSGVAYIGDFQLEPSNKVSSYIPTSGISLIRAADQFTLNLAGNYSFSTKRSILNFNFRSSNYVAGDTVFSLFSSNVDYSYDLKADANSNLIMYTGPSTNKQQTSSASVDSNEVSYLLSVINGESTLNTLNIGSDKNNANQFNGWVNLIYMYK